ncbi:ATP-binding cassette domain-containing protein [Rhodovulum steppense]|uniref:Thiamine transport system ATP-binding protein n=1 Tax=Rhodovulum steppense TaxID=540251 RepID=A0A4V2R583_9RHOB|nr:ATP-binding cassette domain-containing protein [Rhodovulum steppense]TCM87594.1 thiamine transport system ATP-binding protein [Rhodovulum steppense]
MLRLERLGIVQGAFRLSADLAIETGRIIALLGPSGAGKSTLLDVIAGFLPPTSGRVLWNDADLAPLPPGARPVSMLFQDNNLFPHLSAAQNVGLGLRPDLRLSADQRSAVDLALTRVGLEGLGARKPAELSGGQRSRVALARMLLRGRPLMLLDEPFAALGPALKAEMLGLVAELARETGATVLLVTHDPADAGAIADETVLVADGIAHPPRPTRALLADPPAALRAYLG